MAMPPQIREIIDSLADDVYDVYGDAVPRVIPLTPQERAHAVAAARYMARRLLRRGWRRVGADSLPQCPLGNISCFDPEPHASCKL